MAAKIVLNKQLEFPESLALATSHSKLLPPPDFTVYFDALFPKTKEGTTLEVQNGKVIVDGVQTTVEWRRAGRFADHDPAVPVVWTPLGGSAKSAIVVSVGPVFTNLDDDTEFENPDSRSGDHKYQVSLRATSSWAASERVSRITQRHKVTLSEVCMHVHVSGMCMHTCILRMRSFSHRLKNPRLISAGHSPSKGLRTCQMQKRRLRLAIAPRMAQPLGSSRMAVSCISTKAASSFTPWLSALGLG